MRPRLLLRDLASSSNPCNVSGAILVPNCTRRFPASSGLLPERFVAVRISLANCISVC